MSNIYHEAKRVYLRSRQSLTEGSKGLSVKKAIKKGEWNLVMDRLTKHGQWDYQVITPGGGSGGSATSTTDLQQAIEIALKGSKAKRADRVWVIVAPGGKVVKAYWMDPKTYRELKEKAPPGFEGTVKALKKHKGIGNPFALAWWMKKKGYKSHRGPRGGKK